MKKCLKTALAAAFVAVASMPALATDNNAREVFTDSLMNNHKMIFWGEGDNPHQDSIRSLVENFYYDQFRSFQDPAAPYFLFMSRDANLAMGIGGMVRMRGYFDWGGSVNVPAFSPYFIPTSKDPLSDRLLGTTPAGTCLFFRVIGKNHNVGTYQLYIEANFNGYSSRDFHLKKAYAVINDWTIGYAPSTFGDESAVPPTVDSNGPTMKMSNTAVLVRYMHQFKSGLVVAASVETPSMSVQETEGVVAARSQYVPNFAAFVQYQWSRNEHVRLSAITRFLPYRDLLTNTNHTPVGYGLQLSAVYSPVSPLTLYATFNTGRSYSNYGGDFLLGRYDLVEDLAAPGRLKTVPGFGYFVGVQYHFTPSVFVSTTFGQGRNLPTADRPGTDYKYGLYSATNVFWNLTARIQVGAEFNIGKRENFDGSHGWARRIGLLAGFSF